MSANKPTLLIVDDEQMNRDALSRRLAKHGYAVALAASGAEALALVKEQPFDLVLLDVMMPEMDGLEVLSSIREAHSLAELPVIMVTARDQSADVVAALQMGANDYVTKPINFPVILARIQTQLLLKSAVSNSQSLEPVGVGAAAEPALAEVGAGSRGRVAAAHAPTPTPEPAATETKTVRVPNVRTPAETLPAIPGYEIVSELGRGGMGIVYKARHTFTNRTVALKILNPENASAETIRRFSKEVEALGQMAHRNVVMVYDGGMVNDNLFFAMEYVEGVDLGKLVKQRGPLPVHLATDFICQAAMGLQHAFEKDLVHRDIKPSNLFVTWKTGPGTDAGPPAANGGLPARRSGGLLKILDLGLALLNTPPDMKKAHHSVTREGQFIGTVAYMAPEQWMNAHLVDVRADIYSLGCTFYYLLTAQVPFLGESPMEVMIKHSQEEPPRISTLRSDVPSRVLMAIQRMMAKRPGDRFPTPRKVAEALV